MTQFTDVRGQPYNYQYDSIGRLNDMNATVCTDWAGSTCDYWSTVFHVTAAYGSAGQITDLTTSVP